MGNTAPNFLGSKPAAGAPPAKNPSLAPHAVPLAQQAILQLRVAVSQSLLYAIGTRQFDKVCETTLETLTKLLDAVSPFHISVTRNEAIVNGGRLESPTAVKAANEYLEKAFNAAGVSSLRMEKGLTGDELGPFLQLLAQKKFGSSDGAEINKMLHEQGITHIQVGELRYVAVGEKQKVIAGDGVLSGNSETAVNEAVSAVADVVKAAGDETSSQQLRSDFAEQIIATDDAMIGQIVDTVSHHLRASGRGDLNDLLTVPERDAAIFSEVSTLATLLAARGLGGTDQVWKPLRELCARLLNPYTHRANEILPLLKIDPAALPLLPDWLQKLHGAMHGTPAQRAQAMLAQNAVGLLEEKAFAQVCVVLQELTGAGNADAVNKLLEHLCIALSAPAKKDRLLAIQRLTDLAGMCASPEVEQLVVYNFKNTSLHETSPDVMQIFIDFYKSRCSAYYSLGAGPAALEMLQWLSSLQQHDSKTLREATRRQARAAVDDLARNEFAAAVREKFVEGGEDGAVACEILKYLGRDSYLGLFEKIKTDPSEQNAAALLQRLGAIGGDAIDMFFRQLGEETDKAAILRAINIAALSGHTVQLTSLLPVFLHHTDDAVRQTAIGYVLKLAPEDALQMLMQGVTDEAELPRRKLLLQAVLKLKDIELATNALLAAAEAALTADQDDYATLVLEILAPLAPPAIIPILNKNIFQRQRGMLGGKTAGKPLVLAGIKCLARHYTMPSSIEILEKCRQDKDPEISRFALVTQRGLVAAEGQASAAATTAPASNPVLNAVKPSISTAAAASVRPLVAGETNVQRHPPSTTRMLHRGFEDSDVVPRRKPTPAAGSAVPASLSGANAAVPASLSAANAAAVPSGVGTVPPGAKASFQGKIQDIGLLRLLTMVSAKNGLLMINGPAGDAPIYIDDKAVIYVTYKQQKEVAALALIEALKEGAFAFYPGVALEKPMCYLPVTVIPSRIEDFRDQAEQNLYY